MLMSVSGDVYDSVSDHRVGGLHVTYEWTVIVIIKQNYNQHVDFLKKNCSLDIVTILAIITHLS